jgi:hypothetical protein
VKVCSTFFSEDQARETLEFLKCVGEARERYPLYIHCEGGVGRSAAIGFFAAKKYGVEKVWRSGLTFPNKWVTEMLERLDGEGKD